MSGNPNTQPSELIVEPTAAASWHRLVREAAQACQVQLDEALEAYLVQTLIHLTRDLELGQRAVALEYLQALQATGSRAGVDLRRVGDHCLLLAGLYPGLARRRLVRVSYFVRMGRSAYSHLSARLERQHQRLFQRLSEAFVHLTDVLHGLRNEPPFSELEAMEYWQDTGSPAQWRRLNQRFGPGWVSGNSGHQ